MSNTKLTGGILGVALGLVLAAGLAIDSRAANEAAAPAGPGAAPAGLFPVYRPPLRGAPERRIGGGTRGEAGTSVTLQVLAPVEAGLTVAEQPTLYWYISRRSNVRLQLTLIDDQAIEPVLEVELREPVEAGIHPFSLAEHGIRLQPETDYQWFVVLVQDPSQRSQDVLAGAVIRRIAPPPDLARAVADAGDGGAASVYAGRGLWYDALDAISGRIRAHPADSALREQRAALLEQVGIADAADFDRRAAR